jgi:hypothetical protein
MKFIEYFESFTKQQLELLKNEDKTYLKRRFKEDVEIPEEYSKYIQQIKNYDIDTFDIQIFPYGIYIKPDEKFKQLLNNINFFLEDKISLDTSFDFSIDESNLNLIDFEKGIPKLLIGFGLGYKLYKLLISHVYYITSNNFSSKFAINLWHSLVLDKDYLCFTSKNISGIIHKHIKNIELKKILEKLKNNESYLHNYNFNEIIFDDDLLIKIMEIYGSLDIYKK